MSNIGRLLVCAASLIAWLGVANAASPELQKVSITVDGTARVFYVYAPAGLTDAAAVMVFHGFQGDGPSVANMSRMAQAAEKDGFVSVFPDAINGRWNAIPGTIKINDVGFVDAIINVLVEDWNVDPSKVYAAGISNGGFFTQRLACELDLAGHAVVAANMPVETKAVCLTPSNPAPMVFFHGTADDQMPFAGGSAGGVFKIPVISSVDTVKFWENAAGCGNTITKRTLPNRTSDGTTVTYEGYESGCKIVGRYIINGGGHAWPGSPVRLPGEVTSRDLNATDAMLKLFGLRR